MPTAPNESLPGEPSNIERRQQADADTEDRNNSGDKRARNIRAYHESQIAELQKEIDVHQAIVDEQNAMIDGDREYGTSSTPLPAGTDIGAKFNQGENGDDDPAPSRVDDLKQQERDRENEENEGGDKGGNGDNTTSTSDIPEPTSTPATPVDDDAPKKDEEEANATGDTTTGDTTTGDATPVAKSPTKSSPSPKRDNK